MEELFNKTLLNSNVILFYGSPLSGKGTQSKLLAKHLNIPVVSSGDVFRDLCKNNSTSELAIELNNYMSRGELVPNELVKRVFINKFSDPLYFNGFILDGFVREKDNAYLLDEILSNLDLKLACIINMECSKEILVNRLSQRKQTDNRSDDEIQIFEKRFDICKTNSEQILPYYSDKLINIDASQNIDNVFNELKKSVKNIFVKQYVGKDLLKLNELFEYVLAYTYQTHNTPSYDLIKTFIKLSLQINEHNKTGLMRRFIILKTLNKHKFNEFINDLNKYGIETLVVCHSFEAKWYKMLYDACIEINSELSNSQINSQIEYRLLGIFEEKTSLLRYYCKDTDDETKYTTIQLKHYYTNNTNNKKIIKAINYSILNVYILNKTLKCVECLSYKHKTPGYIDFERKTNFNTDVFGWDDIFVMENNGYTFNELKKLGLKLSSRNMNISKWFKSFIHYKKLTDLNFNPINTERSVDFISTSNSNQTITIDAYDFVKKHKYWSNDLAIKCGLYNMFINVVNKGVFFKSPSNRRIKNYWYPGLNGGIPLVPKTDEIHECTYMAHDFGHFGIPDLIFTGNDSILHKRVYICWRMMSEAFTMCMADMAFVDTLVQSGVSYDYGKRKIYNLFADLKLNLTLSGDKQTYFTNLKKIIWANYKFCLFGDDQPYIDLLIEAGNNEECAKNMPSLIEFKKKYVPFFVSDYKWTEANYNNMVNKSDELRMWYDNNKDIIESLENLNTIDDIINILQLNLLESSIDQSDQSNQTLYDTLFNYVFDNIVVKLYDDIVIDDIQIRKTKAFKRYMVGQSAIFFKFYFVREFCTTSNIIEFHHKIKMFLEKDILSDEEIIATRNYYDEYLNILTKKNLISEDDCITYREVYPIFDPMYLSYDIDINETIESVAKKVFDESNFNSNKPILNKHTKILSQIIQYTGGIIDNNMFVTKPGIMLLSDLGHEHPENLVTFIIAGCSVEASLELIAHKEAKVARLTTSKTNAMNEPLYRIYEKLHGVNVDTRWQKQYLKEILNIRTEWNNKDYIGGEIPDEIFNTFNVANKCTVLCYSMNLEDLHKLFIGRSGYNGNESEVREIIHRMINILHEKYPNIIHNIDEYDQMANKEKLNCNSNKTNNSNKSNNSNNLSNGETIITPQAKFLFNKLNICSELPDFLQMAEFRSRITYLAFNKNKQSLEQSLSYNKKIIQEYGHMSVLSAWQIVKNDNFYNVKSIYETYVGMKIKYESHNIFTENFIENFLLTL